MNCFRVDKFSSVGLHGKGWVSFGGRVLLGHLHGWSACVGTPLLEQDGGVVEAVAVAPAIVAGGQLPIDGKFWGQVWSCSQQSLNR